MAKFDSFDGFRIHCRTESLDTVFDPTRPDGWVAGDETRETQPHGVSACATLTLLAKFARLYSMAVRPADVLLGLKGTDIGGDRDQYATRILVDEFEEIGTGAEFTAAAKGADILRRTDDDAAACEALGAVDSRRTRALMREMARGR